MSEQRHVIKRQVLNLEVGRVDDAQQFQDRMSQVFRSRIVPLIDRFCTELSDPDSIHRIATLELDVGDIDTRNFEEEFVRKLSTQLERRLADEINAQRRKSGDGTDKSTVNSQLELLDIFARTGTLPWWVDASQPRLLEHALTHLIRHAPSPLRQLLRQMAAQQKPLRRLIHNYSDTLLTDLVGVLTGSPQPGFPGLLLGLLRSLQNSTVTAGVQPRALRHSFWHAVLHNATLRPADCRVPRTVCRDVLQHVATQCQTDFNTLVSDLRQVERKTSDERPLQEVLDALCTEAEGGKFAATHDRETLATTIERLRTALQQGRLSKTTARNWLADLQQPSAHQLPADILSKLTALLREAAHEEPQSKEDAVPPDEESLQDTNRRLQVALAKGGLPAATIQNWLADLQQSADRQLTAEVFSRLTEMLEEATSLEPQPEIDSVRDQESLQEAIQRLRAALSKGDLSTTTMLKWLADLQQPTGRQSPADVLSDLMSMLSEATQGEAQDDAAPHDLESLQEIIQQLRVALPNGELSATMLRQWLADLQNHKAIGLPPNVLSALTKMLQDTIQMDLVGDLAAAPQEAESGREMFRLLRHMARLGLLPASTIRNWLADSQRPEALLSELNPLLPAATTSVLGSGETPVPGAPESLQQTIEILRRTWAAGLLPRQTMQQWIEDLQQSGTSQLPPDVSSELTRLLEEATADDARLAEPEEELQVDLRFSDADEWYVNNAGLVILSPFLGHFFGHLGLMEDNQFKDEASLQRAVGLLNYLASEQATPAEYSLPLCKALCGMELTEVFDFGPPVTEAETAECTNLLTAVIEHASILKDMSVAGFRGTFLIREGVLDTRDGAWLLRVQRESYDVVLDRFPWSMNWVKLSWIEAPLRVEW